MIFLLGNTLVALGIFISRVIHQPFYLTWIILFFSFLFLLVGFDRRVMQVCGDIMGSRSWESIQGLLVGCHARLLIFFNGICFSFMEDNAPSTFIGSWVLVALYLCCI